MKLYQMQETDEHRQQVRDLFSEYLYWANGNLKQEYDISFDIPPMIEDDMKTLGKFLPPGGRLILAEVDEKTAGLACMKTLTDTICEVKRMYVRPEFRRQGLGRALVQQLIDEGKQMGYPTMRLDSARFMKGAHALYRSMGFTEIEPYEGSEIPKEFQPNWVFMELALDG